MPGTRRRELTMRIEMRYGALMPERAISLETRSAKQMKLGMFHNVQQKA